MTVKQFADGAVVFKQGELSGTVYLVQSGTVRITKTAPDGAVVALGTVGPHGLFGEMALIDSTLRMATATAIGPTACLTMEAAQLTKQLERLSGEALRLYNDMLAYIRGTLPFEARTPQQQARGETDKDREARRLLDDLPSAMAAQKDLPPIMRAVLQVLSQYVQRRLPPLGTRG